MFRDRREAGRVLAGKLERYRDELGLVVVALPRGGVPVGYEVAKAFDAALALGARRPARIVVAVPVAAEETCEELRREVDEVVCALTPRPFVAVGTWYRDFAQTADDQCARSSTVPEVRRARRAAPARARSARARRGSAGGASA